MKRVSVEAVLVILLSLGFGGNASAGGTSFTTQIVRFDSHGKDRYRVVMLWPQSDGSTKRVVVHLRHSSGLRPDPPDYMSEASYKACIAKLMLHFKRGEKFPFGLMGRGLVPVKNKPNEYQSNTLAEITEHTGRKVCYSFAY